MKDKKDIVQEYTRVWAEEAHRCSKCGKCRSFCPVFLETGDEKMGTRGRLSLAAALAANQVAPTKEFLRSISTCMRCLRCTRECPSQVNFDRLIRAVRGALGRRVWRYQAANLLVGALLENRWMMDAAVRCGAIAQRFLPKGSARWVRELPFFYRGSAVTPRFASQPALRTHGGYHRTQKSRMTVMLYTGCVINYLYPDIAQSVIDVLNRGGVDVIVSPRELCCGIPAISAGDHATAKRLARHNVHLVRKFNVDYVVCACSTCTHTFMKDYPELIGEDAAAFAKKAMDVSCFIRNVLGLTAARTDVTATYHDPCHMRFGMNVTKEPRELIAQASRFVEMPCADKCCGMAGAFGIINHAISKKIFERKAAAVRSSGAQVVATSCPSCMMQLRGQLHDRGIAVDVVHTVELFRRGMIEKQKREK
ncbi:MAG TPA: (Fe-S)-binding protein [bacterium]|nr:(Fe-S)-binding protein [bacterium]